MLNDCFLVLSQIIFKMVEEYPRDVRRDMDALNIIYGDETLPHLYENSRISEDQLPSQSGEYFFFFGMGCILIILY